MRFSIEYSNRRYRVVGSILFLAILSLTVLSVAVSRGEFQFLKLAMIPMWSFAFITAFVFFGRVKKVYDRGGKVEVFGIIIGVLGLGASALIYLVVLPSAFTFDAKRSADVLTAISGSFIGFLFAYLFAPTILKHDQS